jgi:hypothetical protein
MAAVAEASFGADQVDGGVGGRGYCAACQLDTRLHGDLSL